MPVYAGTQSLGVVASLWGVEVLLAVVPGLKGNYVPAAEKNALRCHADHFSTSILRLRQLALHYGCLIFSADAQNCEIVCVWHPSHSCWRLRRVLAFSSWHLRGIVACRLGVACVSPVVAFPLDRWQKRKLRWSCSTVAFKELVCSTSSVVQVCAVSMSYCANDVLRQKTQRLMMAVIAPQ